MRGSILQLNFKRLVCVHTLKYLRKEPKMAKRIFGVLVILAFGVGALILYMKGINDSLARLMGPPGTIHAFQGTVTKLSFYSDDGQLLDGAIDVVVVGQQVDCTEDCGRRLDDQFPLDHNSKDLRLGDHITIQCEVRQRNYFFETPKEDCTIVAIE